MVRRGHPIGRAKLTKENFSSLGYIHAGTSALGHQMVEQWLADAGIKRPIAIRLGHFSVAPATVNDTNFAVIFPESVARQIASAKDFRLLALPFDLPLGRDHGPYPRRLRSRALLFSFMSKITAKHLTYNKSTKKMPRIGATRLPNRRDLFDRGRHLTLLLACARAVALPMIIFSDCVVVPLLIGRAMTSFP
jgi:hypothetical protein